MVLKIVVRAENIVVELPQFAEQLSHAYYIFVTCTMFDPTGPFTIEYKEMTCKAQQYDVQGSTVFMISFPDNTPTLLIARTEGPGGKFWTSVPEGREKEAEAVGEQVLGHLQKK